MEISYSDSTKPADMAREAMLNSKIWTYIHTTDGFNNREYVVAVGVISSLEMRPHVYRMVVGSGADICGYYGELGQTNADYYYISYCDFHNKHRGVYNLLHQYIETILIEHEAYECFRYINIILEILPIAV